MWGATSPLNPPLHPTCPFIPPLMCPDTSSCKPLHPTHPPTHPFTHPPVLHALVGQHPALEDALHEGGHVCVWCQPVTTKLTLSHLSQTATLL